MQILVCMIMQFFWLVFASIFKITFSRLGLTTLSLYQNYKGSLRPVCYRNVAKWAEVLTDV